MCEVSYRYDRTDGRFFPVSSRFGYDKVNKRVVR